MSKYEASRDIVLATLGTIKDPAHSTHIEVDIRSYDGEMPKLNMARWVPAVVENGKEKLPARRIPVNRLTLVEALQFGKMNAAAVAEGGAFHQALEAFVAGPTEVKAEAV